jgi:hypothetical protein
MALAEVAVVIDPRERQVFEREVSQPVQRRLRGKGAGGDVRQQRFQLGGCHATCGTGSR